MKPYIFIIPNKKLKIYFLFAIGIILLNILGFTVYAAANTNRVSNSWIMLIFISGIISGAFYLLSPKKRLEFAGTMILLSGIFWISRGFNELFFANLILWLLYSISRRRLLVLIDAEQIIYPSFPKKRISWNDINTIILKDDILTIDLKNNKIYQHLIEYADNPVNQEEFNEFCSQQLLSSN